MRRFLKKIGAIELRIFGYTPALAAKKEMVECNQRGEVLGGVCLTQQKDTNALDAFKLGETFQVTGKKSLRAWVEKNADNLNAAGVDIQGLVIAKWCKYFGNESMPGTCTFIVSSKEPDIIPETIGKPKIDIGM